MAARGSTLGRKQEDAIAALLVQRNIDEAARAAGIGARTMLRWMKLPEFQKAYREARRQAFGQAIARLQQASSAAVSVLHKVMVDAGTPASTKVRAADSVLNHAIRGIEADDILERLAALEQANASTKQRP